MLIFLSRNKNFMITLFLKDFVRPITCAELSVKSTLSIVYGSTYCQSLNIRLWKYKKNKRRFDNNIIIWFMAFKHWTQFSQFFIIHLNRNNQMFFFYIFLSKINFWKRTYSSDHKIWWQKYLSALNQLEIVFFLSSCLRRIIDIIL